MSRRGSVLVLAIAVLAVMSLLAVSYISVVRIDRRSTDAYQKQESLQQQVDVAVSYLQAILTADLFGGINVNSGTPRKHPDTGEPNFPTAFNDGEYADVPWTDVDLDNVGNTFTGARYTWDTEFATPMDTNPEPKMDSRLELSSWGRPLRAFADDPWLAPIEPVDTKNSQASEDEEWDTWPQITNLRSMYRWRSFPPNIMYFARDDGRFADLAMFLLARNPEGPPNGNYPGNPGAFLELNADQNDLWIDPFTDQENSPALGVSQEVYAYHMSDLQEEFYPFSGMTDPGRRQRDLLPADERFWADTDGDGRPDARWQTLPILGNTFKMRWAIAARIIDNSGLANLNAHIAFGYDGTLSYTSQDQLDLLGDGRTPADVDLFRLIASQVWDAKRFDANTNPYQPEDSSHPDIARNQLFDFPQGTMILLPPSGVNTNALTALERSWRMHLDFGLRIPNILDQLFELNANGPPGTDLFDLQNSFSNIVSINEPTEWPTNPLQLHGVNAIRNDNNPDLLQNPLTLRRLERAAIWRYFSANPDRPTTAAGVPYPISDEVDLRAFGGFNRTQSISRLEQRLDGPVPENQDGVGFLPNTGSNYDGSDSDAPSLGPLRSKEWDDLSASARSSQLTGFILEDNNDEGESGGYTNKDQLERLRKDRRHLLTTISGAGSIGPIPVLSRADEFKSVFSKRKVDLNRFFAVDNGTGNPVLPGVNAIRDPIRDSFAAWVWGLAPLATNLPLMAPLDTIDTTTYANLAGNSNLHYGGGQGPSGKGPADETAKRYASIPNMDMGASYAIQRALALTVNLADAIDNESGASPQTTTESPTIVRFFNQPDLDYFLSQNPLLIDPTTGLAAIGVIPLGVRFPQGDIWPTILDDTFAPNTGDNLDALPKEVVGDPQNGVSVIGLDRQPFLVQAVSIVVYANSNANENALVDAADTTIEPDAPEDVLGSFFAVELGNPWSEELDLAAYSVRIEDGMVDFVLDFNAAVIDGGGQILAGQTVVFYFFSDVSAEASAIGPGATAAWDEIKPEILSAFSDNGQGVPVSIRLIQPGQDGQPSLQGTAFSQDGDMFGDLAGQSLPVLLTRKSASFDMLVDRLTPPGGEVFPIKLNNALDLVALAPQPCQPGIPCGYAGRAAVQSSIRRPTESTGPNSTGFPAYVIERPGNNAAKVQEDGDILQIWRVGANIMLFEGLPASDLADELKDLGELALLGEEKGFDGSDSIEPAPFELFVPNTPLLAVSELGLLSPYAHMYIHPDQSPPSIVDAWDSSAYLGPSSLGPGSWITVSEQLGWDEHLRYDASPNALSSTNPQPYLASLDFSRYILGGDLRSAVLANVIPDALAVPLAARVFDAFEALPVPDAEGLVRGRVNMNTAPRRILELLPLLDPRDPVRGMPLTDIAGWNPSDHMGPNQPNNSRLEWLDRYRRRDNAKPGMAGVQNDPSDDAFPDDKDIARAQLESYTNLTGLRRPPNPQVAPWGLGLVASGEIASMGRWSNNGLLEGQNDVTSGAATSPGFLELGVNEQDNSPVVSSNKISPTDIRIFDNAASFDAQDDPEERLALYRAISNIVSTRSDIFTAWFILRAYDPKDIEAITVGANLGEKEIVDLMNPGSAFAVNPQEHRGLLPAFEKRILVIFDRSNVRTPTDRPRILLQVELPIN